MLFRSLDWEDPLEKEIAIRLPGESHGQRSLVGYRLWGCKESDMTEGLTFALQVGPEKHLIKS